MLYGEPHPCEDDLSACLENDLSLRPDLLLVMGTSLKVKGIQRVVTEFAKTVHNKKGGTVIFVNLTKPADSIWSNLIDYWVNMDCDRYVADLKKRRPNIFTVQTRIPFMGVGKSTEKKNGNSKSNSHREKAELSQEAGIEGKENDPPSLLQSGLLSRKTKESLSEQPSTPVKNRRTPLKMTQLPTPPSSGSQSRKRPLTRESERTLGPDETPSKKRRKFNIWSELSDSAIPVSEDAGLDPDIGKAKRSKDMEIPDSDDASSPTTDTICLEDRIQVLRNLALKARQRGGPKKVVTKKSRPIPVAKRRIVER